MNREDAELDRLLRLARQADLPDTARVARVRARILPPTAAPAPAPKAVAAAGKGILGAKIVAGLAAVALGVWSYVDLTRPLPVSAVPIVAPAPQPDDALPTPPQPEPAPASAGAPAEPALREVPREATLKPRAKKPRTNAAATRASTLAQEAALLQLVAVELRAGQVERARASLAEFARRYPDSALNADREKLERRLAQSQPLP